MSVVFNRVQNDKVQLAGEQARDYLSKDSTSALKGIFAICILIHHLYQYSGLVRSPGVAIALQALGYLSCGEFFFLSGYGVAVQSEKRPDYIRRFPEERLIPYYAVYVFVSLVYVLRDLLLKMALPISRYVLGLTFADVVITNGWFLQVLFILYVFYYFANRIIPKYGLFILFIEILLYCLVHSYTDDYWLKYEAIFPFLIGVIWCRYRSEIDYILGRFPVMCFAVDVLIFRSSFIRSLNQQKAVQGLVFAKMVSAIAFVILIAIIVREIKIDNRFTLLLGKYSSAIYFFQGLGLVQLKDYFITGHQKPWMFVITEILLTITVSIALNPFMKVIDKITKIKMKEIKNSR